MLTRITSKVNTQIKNPVFRDNAEIYLNIEQAFYSTIQQFGLPLASDEALPEDTSTLDEAASRLKEHGVVVANDTKSLRWGWLSPSCQACQKGVGSATYTISTRCPRDCFFCFNPNQDNYERLQHEMQDPSAELKSLHAQGARLTDIALTGGEPLVHKDETIAFFKTARELFPRAYTRLYTSGSYLDAACLDALASADLNEIRFSFKTDDSKAAQQKTFDRIALARKRLQHVVVEMPVMPGELEPMQDLLVKFDELGVDGINLLELCFPFNNAEEFSQRGYALKARPFRVLYNYWYAGGLPIAGSEQVCLQLVEFAAQQKLNMGVHYCSLENKFSGQIYQQNYPPHKEYPFCVFSERDFFLKSAKVYGSDADRIAPLLAQKNLKQVRYDKQAKTLEFLPTYLSELKAGAPHAEVAISYHVIEHDQQGQALRELRLDLTSPERFDGSVDL